MKQIIFFLGQNLLRQFLTTPVDHGPSPSVALLEPFKDYAAESVRKYAIVAGLGFLFSLYFVAGTLIMITAAANSFDAFGFFTAGSFFYAGVALTVISVAVLAGCYVSMKRGSKAKHEEVREVVPVAQPSFPPIAHFAEALLTGVVSGLISRKLARPPAPITLRERIRQVI